MQLFVTRLISGQDLCQSIADYAQRQNIGAGVIVSSVGSLSKARVRMAGATQDDQNIQDYDGPLEILSINGTIARDAMHLHLSFSDKQGEQHGGHLSEGCIVHTTVELGILVDESQQFDRQLDPTTGFSELVINKV